MWSGGGELVAFVFSFSFCCSGERPYRCQTCERTFTLKHSLVRHQRIHQKARHSKQRDRDIEKDDSEDESTHSANNPVSEDEAESSPSTSNHVAITRSRKECSHEEKAAAERAAEPSHDDPREQASPGETDPQSPAALVQDLLELCSKRPAPVLTATDSASKLLGME